MTNENWEDLRRDIANNTELQMLYLRGNERWNIKPRTKNVSISRASKQLCAIQPYLERVGGERYDRLQLQVTGYDREPSSKRTNKTRILIPNGLSRVKSQTPKNNFLKNSAVDDDVCSAPIALSRSAPLTSTLS